MFVTIIIMLMLLYEFSKFISPEWEITQRNAVAKMAQDKKNQGRSSVVMTGDISKYFVYNLLYNLAELILFLTFDPKYMIAAISIKILSKIVNKNGERVMDETIIRIDSLATMAILIMAMVI